MSAQSEVNPASMGVVLATFVAAITTGLVIANSAIAIFIAPIAADFGWSHAEISAAATALYLGMGSGCPFWGPVVDRYGGRAVVLPLAVLTGLLLGSISFVGKSLPLFYAVHFLLGVATPGAVAYNKLISTWFFRRRGIAMTVFGAGTFVASMIVPPIGHLLLEHVGWQAAYGFFAAGAIIVAFPALLIFFRERPGGGGVGMMSDGAPPISIARAIRSKAYWLIVTVQTAGYFVYLGLGTHMVGIMSERGLDAATATLGVSIFAAGGLVAQFATGILLDKFNTPMVILPLAALSVASLALLWISQGDWLVLGAVLLLGFGCSGQISMVSYFTSRYFGVRNFSAILGTIVPALFFLSAPAPLILGAIFDATRSYGPALMVLEASLTVSVIAVLLLHPYPYPVSPHAEPVQDQAESAQM